MMYVRYPLSPRNVEDLLFERGIDICHETVRLWWNRFGPMFASEIRRKRGQHMRSHTHWRWHLDEVFVWINGKQKYLWRAVDQGRGPGILCDRDSRQSRGVEVHQESHETPRTDQGDRDRSPALVRRRAEADRR